MLDPSRAAELHFAKAAMKLRRLARVVAFGALCATALPAAAQQAVLREDRPALKFEATSMFSQPGNAGVTFVDYLDRGGEPAFRFHVRHIHEGQCEGFLYITRSRIAYDASFTPAFQAHAFEVSRTELKEAKPASSPLGSYWSVTFQRGTPADSSFVPLFDYGGATGKTLHAPGDNAALSAFFVRAVASFDAAKGEFDQLTAALRPQPQPVSGAALGQSARAAMAEAPRFPEVVDVSEPRDNEVKQEKITVRGIAYDATGIRSVEVWGRVAAMRPSRVGRGMEFWVEDVPLQEGDNLIEIVVTNVAELQGKTTIRVRRVGGAAGSRVFGVEDVVKLLESGASNLRIKTLVRENGVNFELTPAIRSQLRTLGADPALLQEIEKAKK